MDNNMDIDLNKKSLTNEFYRLAGKVMVEIGEGKITEMTDLSLIKSACDSLSKIVDYQMHPAKAIDEILSR